MDAEIYRTEALELLDELEEALLGLEERPDDRKLVNRVFRVPGRTTACPQAAAEV